VNTFKLTCGHLGVSEDMISGTQVLICPVCDEMRTIVEQVNKPEVSTVVNGAAPERSYGCSWGCGNAYDYIIISVADGTTEFLDLVCLLKLCQDMIGAVINPDDPQVKAAMAEYASLERTPMNEGRVRKRGKNAPATADDDDLIEAFDSRITTDDLGDEFR
jgi:hypothetical protein